MTDVKPFRDDLGWCWQMMSGRLLLVTDGGGAQVILAGAHHAHIQTRDPETGMLRALLETDHVAKMIVSAPDLRRAARDLIHGIRLGFVKVEAVDRDVRPSLTDIMQRLIEAAERPGS